MPERGDVLCGLSPERYRAHLDDHTRETHDTIERTVPVSPETAKAALRQVEAHGAAPRGPARGPRSWCCARCRASRTSRAAGSPCAPRRRSRAGPACAPASTATAAPRTAPRTISTCTPERSEAAPARSGRRGSAGGPDPWRPAAIVLRLGLPCGPDAARPSETALPRDDDRRHVEPLRRLLRSRRSPRRARPHRAGAHAPHSGPRPHRRRGRDRRGRGAAADDLPQLARDRHRHDARRPPALAGAGLPASSGDAARRRRGDRRGPRRGARRRGGPHRARDRPRGRSSRAARGPRAAPWARSSAT